VRKGQVHCIGVWADTCGFIRSFLGVLHHKCRPLKIDINIRFLHIILFHYIFESHDALRICTGKVQYYKHIFSKMLFTSLHKPSTLTPYNTHAHHSQTSQPIQTVFSVTFLLPNAYVIPPATRFTAATPIVAPLVNPRAPNLFVSRPRIPAPPALLRRTSRR